MTKRFAMGCTGAAVAFSVLTLGIVQGEQPGAARPNRDQLREPVYRVAQQPTDNRPAETQGQGGEAQQEHPLIRPLHIANDIKTHIEADVKDYTATMFKRERINGELREREAMYVKVRHEPFSVYTYFLSPQKIKGREAIYVDGRNNNKLVAHDVGLRGIITVSLDPTGNLAMDGQRYPITEIGFKNLTKRLIEVAEKDSKYGECDVKIYDNAKVANRACTSIVVTHPNPRKNFLFNVAKVFIDKELNVPVRYEAYEWPSTPGGQPELLEEYTYTNIKINQGLTDADFDQHNQGYKFP